MKKLLIISLIALVFVDIQLLFAESIELGPLEISIIKAESFLDDYSKIMLQAKNVSNDHIKTCILTCVLRKDGTILNYQDNFINNLSPGDDVLMTYIIKEPRNSWNQIGFRMKRIR